jgi:uncharacterized protein (TIGR03086 family)
MPGDPTVVLAEGVRYALEAAAMAARRPLTASTPCPGWDLDDLLRHLAESMAVLDQVIAGADCRGTGPVESPHPVELPDPVELLRDRAADLLWTALTAADLTGRAGPLIAVGAIEITVHGWDVTVACGSPRRIPPRLARPLLAVAGRLIQDRAGLFGQPMPMPRCASPGDKLVAWLGRDPAISYRRVA